VIYPVETNVQEVQIKTVQIVPHHIITLKGQILVYQVAQIKLIFLDPFVLHLVIAITILTLQMHLLVMNVQQTVLHVIP